MEVVDRYTCSWVQVLCLEGLYLFLDCLPRRSGCRVSSLFSVLTRGAERSCSMFNTSTVIIGPSNIDRYVPCWSILGLGVLLQVS